MQAGPAYPEAASSGDQCPAPPVERRPKDRFFFDGKCWVDYKTKADPQPIDYDNVAQSFIEARYRALVPGKHDFYYGPERLRELATLLATNAPPVRMLGANLAFSTTIAPGISNVHPRTPERLASHPFKTDFGDLVSVDLPEMVFPYKQQFVVKNAHRVSYLNGSGLVPSDQVAETPLKEVKYDSLILEAKICRETGDKTTGDPYDVPFPGGKRTTACSDVIPAKEACRASLTSTCQALSAKRGVLDPDPDAKASTDEVYLFKDPRLYLVPGLNHLFCARISEKSPNDWVCKPFPVQIPFFSSVRPSQYNPDQAGPSDPFVVVHSKKGDLAIFGVVDPNLLANVGLVNDSWLNRNHRMDTTTKVAPADYALLQALELCNRREACRVAPKILMAQMSYAQAAELISRPAFSAAFDAVLSEADQEHHTGDRDVNESGSLQAKLVLTPPEPTAEPGKFTPTVSVATLTKSAPGICEPASWNLHHQLHKGAEQERAQEEEQKQRFAACSTKPLFSIADASQGTLKALKAVDPPRTSAPTKPAASDSLRDVTLLAMRQYLKTDLALLQKRDFYDPGHRISSQYIPDQELQNQLNRILWKGDFVMPLHLTGATLKKLFKQSKKFDELDHDSLSTDREKNRGLLSLGIFNDPKDSDTYYVNGAKLDDTKLYSVAASDFIALGDTGYSDLATPDVPPAVRVEDFSELRSISGLACEFIVETKYPDRNTKCDTEVLESKYYFDASYRIPFDKTPGFDTLTHYTSFFKRFLPPPEKISQGVEGTVQQRHFWSLNLENLDLNYSGTYINHVTESKGNFAGISTSGVTQSGNNTVGSDHRLRFVYDFRVGTIYALSDSSFMRSSSTTSSVPTISSNMLGSEVGGTWRFPRILRPSWLSFQYSGRFEGQLTDPSQTQITFKLPPGTLPPAAPPIAPLFLNTPRVSAVYGRAGLRAELLSTYLELGLEEVDSRHVLSQYAFSNVPGGPVYCQPAARSQLACGTDPTFNSSFNVAPITADTALALGNPGVPAVNTTDYLTGGAYLNFNFKFPLWSRQDAAGGDQSYYFNLTNKGDFYFNSHNDTSVQTRYLNKLSPSFSLPLYGKVMLTPRVDIVTYENKVNRNHFRAVEPMISLTYSFTCREGMQCGRALGYGAITSAQPANPSH